MKLEVRHFDSGKTKTLQPNYFTAPGYFSAIEAITSNQSHPKSLFGPMPIAGVGSTSITVFYPREYEKEGSVLSLVRYELELASDARRDEDFGILG